MRSDGEQRLRRVARDLLKRSFMKTSGAILTTQRDLARTGAATHAAPAAAGGALLPFPPTGPLPEAMAAQGISARRLTVADAEALVAFDTWAFFEANPDTPPDHRPPHYHAAEIRHALLSGDSIVGLFDEAAGLVAYLWSRILPQHRQLELRSMVVHPRYRDRSIGAWFLEDARRTATRMGLRSCMLAVDPLNGRGLNLYLRLGYRVHAYLEGRAQIDGLDDWLQMVLPLARAPELGRRSLIIRADDKAGLQEALRRRLVGYRLSRHPSGDSRKNAIYFARPL
jgi:ribosomal protein S18 acetylase RimI-like enzyme